MRKPVEMHFYSEISLGSLIEIVVSAIRIGLTLSECESAEKRKIIMKK